MTALVLIGSWICFGGIIVCLKGDGGWVVMISDDRNCRHTWLAFPALILCWVFWPIRRLVGRLCFLIVWSFGL